MRTKYTQLVESATAATRQRKDGLRKAYFDSTSHQMLADCARELDIVNTHITVDPQLVINAAKAYNDLAEMLVAKLRWSSDEIHITPQGSTSTKTLVASPTRADFDIDAVCHVELQRDEAHDPLAFFQEVFDALLTMRPAKKNRCMRINYPNERFYIDFTPSVPLASIPAAARAGMRQVSLYADTALAVVDIPSESWKTSNPAGMVEWVSTQANRQILRFQSISNEAFEKRADIQPVPGQAVPLTDTLRVAIRLFKRHRDMAVLRKRIVGDYMPISVIITTLLTQCYEGMADNNQFYDHPVELLADLAALLPGMIELREGDHWVANPTVDGENFAEKWNFDNEQRFGEFHKWCDLLAADLTSILESSNPTELRERIQETFGCVDVDGPGPKIDEPGWLAAKQPTSVKKIPVTPGLA